jgi:hypothetical protein
MIAGAQKSVVTLHHAVLSQSNQMHQLGPGNQFPYCEELEHIAAHSQSELEEPFFHPDRIDTNPANRPHRQILSSYQFQQTH